MFLVTTDKNRIPADKQIIMLDGTVPGWQAKEGDLHFDHHKPSGMPIQLIEITSVDAGKVQADAVYVTTQVDADAQAAAAWIQILKMQVGATAEYEIYCALAAIAYDCDHLGLPRDEEWNPYREFAAKAVAALKETGNAIAGELGLPVNRKDWTEDQKTEYASTCFERGTEWLIDAALGNRPWPGESGEADTYFERMNSQREQVYANCRIYRGCAIFDQRSFQGYVDPRLLVEWARENGAGNITLTVRDGSRQPNAGKLQEEYNLAMEQHLVASGCSPVFEPLEMFSYTLGSIPLHAEGSPMYSDNYIWQLLQEREETLRNEKLGFATLPQPETKWGGRNEVGGSSWRDPVIMSPEAVIDCVLSVLHA